MNEILNGFKAGSMKDAAFWIDFKGRKIHIAYYPVSAADGKYLGTLEVTQDITELQKITGEKRLLNG